LIGRWFDWQNKKWTCHVVIGTHPAVFEGTSQIERAVFNDTDFGFAVMATPRFPGWFNPEILGAGGTRNASWKTEHRDVTYEIQPASR
jgi:hypothetical protein